MVVFILLHWLSSSHQVSELWTRRDHGDDLVSSLPNRLHVWLTETQKNLVRCPVSTSAWWKGQDWSKLWSHDSLSINVAPTVPFDQWSSRSPDTFFGITRSQQRSECNAFEEPAKREAGICTWNSWSSYPLSNPQNYY